MEFERLIVRVVFAYVAMLLLLRISGKRTIGESSAFDFVLALVLGDLFDDLLWAEVSAGDFSVALATLVGCHSVVAWLSARSTAFERVVSGSPVLLISDGTLQRRAMRSELINEREVDSLLRIGSLPPDAVSEVQEAHLQTSGEMSVILKPAARLAQKSDVRPSRA
jgi:uncharacterized membrane protein YcaP (DUF421 family)